MEKALISVADKTGLVDFLFGLRKQFSFFATGGTYKHLLYNSIACTSVEDYINFPEILSGRVKSLHPKIYGGILSLREQKDEKVFAQYAIEKIAMVVVNFYPFEKKLQENLSLQKLQNFIDIGGPSMLRAAAKNYQFVLPVCDLADYQWILAKLQNNNDISLSLRQKLAAKAFRYCSKMDEQISDYLLGHKKKLRYGENPHQKAYLTSQGFGLADLQKIQGKELSYNNYLDLQSATNILSDFSAKKALSVIIKHNNPCGIATGQNASQSLQNAWQCDMISAFGSTIATNYSIDLECAKFLVDPQKEHFQYSWKNHSYQKNITKKKFFEILMAPSFEKKALEFLQTYTKNNILLQFDKLVVPTQSKKNLDGVCLYQETDLKKDELKCVTKKKFSKNMESLVRFGIGCCKHAKSNAIALVWEYVLGYYQLLGLGHSQPNRIDAFLKLALPKAEENLQRIYIGKKENFLIWKQQQKIVLVSDAFFPFSDLVEAAHYYNISYIVQPGGSKNDKQSTNFCDKNNIAMLFNGLRHFLH